jgi:hypothetical protein
MPVASARGARVVAARAMLLLLRLSFESILDGVAQEWGFAILFDQLVLSTALS